MKKGIENTLWNMKECGCQEDIIREYEKLIDIGRIEKKLLLCLRCIANNCRNK